MFLYSLLALWFLIDMSIWFVYFSVVCYYIYISVFCDLYINLTLILLEQKVISLCHQYRARPACTFVQSVDILNNDNGQKKGRWIIPFKKFMLLTIIKHFKLFTCFYNYHRIHFNQIALKIKLSFSKIILP